MAGKKENVNIERRHNVKKTEMLNGAVERFRALLFSDEKYGEQEITSEQVNKLINQAAQNRYPQSEMQINGGFSFRTYDTDVFIGNVKRKLKHSIGLGMDLDDLTTDDLKSHFESAYEEQSEDGEEHKELFEALINTEKIEDLPATIILTDSDDDEIKDFLERNSFTLGDVFYDDRREKVIEKAKEEDIGSCNSGRIKMLAKDFERIHFFGNTL